MGRMSDQYLVGRIGLVSAAVRGGELPGEVRVVVEGIPHYYIAYSKNAVVKDQQVLVINSRGARQLDVEPWAQSGPGIDDVPDLSERF
jgi:hypothetical protein